jgi:hypothetical protein
MNQKLIRRSTNNATRTERLLLSVYFACGVLQSSIAIAAMVYMTLSLLSFTGFQPAQFPTRFNFAALRYEAPGAEVDRSDAGEEDSARVGLKMNATVELRHEEQRFSPAILELLPHISDSSHDHAY